MSDPYTILGLQRGASTEEAKTAFRKMAKTCHPDLHPNDPDAEKKFKEINAAYEAIEKGEPEQQFFRTAGSSGAFRFEDIFHNVDDLFGVFRAAHQQRNPDTQLECRLTLEDVFNGKELNVDIPNRGSDRTIKVAIPPGIHNGMRVSLAKSGAQNHPNLPPGDLHVFIRILPHQRFVREGNDLLTVQPVTAFDVLLSKEIEVIGIDQKTFMVNIPPSFDSSRKLRLAGQGMPDPYSKVRGDLLIELFIMYPELNARQRVMVERAAELS